jgi:hypothetical protein
MPGVYNECALYQGISDDVMSECGDVTLIEKNKTDSDLIDGGSVKKGLFAHTGVFKYTNTLGAARTVRKLKRLE